MTDSDRDDYLRGVDDGEILTEMPPISPQVMARRPWYYKGMQESISNSNQSSTSRQVLAAC